jgi:hypothetical protein
MATPIPFYQRIVQLCTSLQVPVRLYDGSRNLNSFTDSPVGYHMFLYSHESNSQNVTPAVVSFS